MASLLSPVEEMEEGNSRSSLGDLTKLSDSDGQDHKRAQAVEGAIASQGLVLIVVTLCIGLALALSTALAGGEHPAILAVAVAVGFLLVAVFFYHYDKNNKASSNKMHQQDQAPEHQPHPQERHDNGAVQTVKSVLWSMAGNDTASKASKKASTKRMFAFDDATPNSLWSSTTSSGSGNILDGTASIDNLKGFLSTNRQQQGACFLGTDQGSVHQSKPLAELFTSTTVVYMDLVGFTAWSSVREPSQVFTLLEAIFHTFDSIAERRKVFKVETVGDCYVAVSGVPEPRKDHAVIMAQFANECLTRMPSLCANLEKTLGPDTGDLGLRVGLHSGQVTGGLLRGKRSRFQLFGATVNLASRIESTGLPGKIHLSAPTAELLKEHGYTEWVVPRQEKVNAKGMGDIKTYWLEIKKDILPTGVTGDFSNLNVEIAGDSLAKKQRLVAWMTELLFRLLKQIVARRMVLMAADPKRKADADESVYESFHRKRQGTLLDEVSETIAMPELDANVPEYAGEVSVDSEIHDQLETYVSLVADMYEDNPFHNFEHASHVTMSVAKLLSRIVAPSASEFDVRDKSLADHTYGITSDPLTQFSCVLSALIHDAHHPGVPNAQLVKEGTTMAIRYKETSVAEQHSIDLCWDLLMQPKFKALRSTIYTTSGGLHRFRSLVINSVLATDIVDKDLKNLRNARWEKAFHEGVSMKESENEKTVRDRKATIVIEHLIQASDVAHTMQHWHIFRKWNERLFQEMYKAYREGRAEKDPAEFWYKGEIGFFDFYIIPLAKKLKECGVFGVSSSEYLDYAMKNRAEWELKGEQVVEEMKLNLICLEEQNTDVVA